MKKTRYFIGGLIFITLLLTSTSSAIFINIYNKNQVFGGPVLEVTTNKYDYISGESVIIYLTNIGDETLSGGGPIITIYNENNDIVYQEATYCWYELEPGEFVEWPQWDQTDQQGQQVPNGEYSVEGFLSNGNNGGFVDDAIFYIGIINSDELDQFQTEMTENTLIPIGQVPMPDTPVNVQAAQSFIPTKEILTRVSLFIGKNSTATYPLIVSVREVLTEEDLTTISIDPTQVPTAVFDWVEIDFDNISVTTGQTYYIVALTENITENYYAWGANNDSESYVNGCIWYSVDDGNTWGNESASTNPTNFEDFIIPNGQPNFDDPITWDACFRTYGRDNHPPSASTIDGPNSGKPGISYDFIFNAVDPDVDDVKYIIEWGDGDALTTHLHPSGENISAGHKWDAKGTYNISVKAEDEFGLIGPEITLEITIPRNKALFNTQPILLWLLEIFPILRYLLEL